MVAVFFVFRMRFYAAWCGAEASCISAGLGCYPEKSLCKPGGGPTVSYRYISTGLTSILKEDALIIAHSISLFVWKSHFCCWKLVFMPVCFLSLVVSPDPTTEEKYDFKTIQNIDCYNTDFCVKVRHGMRYWNMTVQWWLHHYIYPNAPFKAYALR